MQGGNWDVPMLLSLVVGVDGVGIEPAADDPPDNGDLSSFSVMVDVDGERENVFAKGPRCVSLSSVAAPLGQSQLHKQERCRSVAAANCEPNILFVSFHDIPDIEPD